MISTRQGTSTIDIIKVKKEKRDIAMKKNSSKEIDLCLGKCIWYQGYKNGKVQWSKLLTQ